MPLLFILKYMFIILPALILIEGWHMLTGAITRNNWWWKVPYALLVLFIIVLVILLLMGYR